MFVWIIESLFKPLTFFKLIDVVSWYSRLINPIVILLVLAEPSKQISSFSHDIIKKNSGKIVKAEEWGLRPLTYQINKSKKAFYYHIKFEGEGNIVNELKNIGNIDKSLLRFLTVKVLKHDL